mmetsp:Transcript_2765/g.4345  ORF Transcript_2765/g.4345 Transcript_2765/m.4345 type:complete len:192 (+) Transcript_2765:530-1105(+)
MVAWAIDYRLPWKYKIEDIPSCWTMFKQTIFCFLIEDFCFHMAHRLVHCKAKWLPLYQWIHKQHHDFKQPYSISASYAHPIEQILANFLPNVIGALILGDSFHFVSFFVFGTLRLIETEESHSGYDFPFTIFRLIPFGTGAAYHYFHHTHNVGNYSSFFTIWDTLLDSNKDYYEVYPEEAWFGSETPKKVK